MRKLIETGRYNSGRRPSEHDIGAQSFKTDNLGAIPPNVIGGDEAPSIGSVLKGSNTHSVDQYQIFCRERELALHPARMPHELAQFFIKFLTDEDDLVLDPFGGSNTTGAVAESLGRRWITCEADWGYASTSITRFAPDAIMRTCEDIMIEPVEVQKPRFALVSG
jgi:site-specific DNA-methyltransferase (cytosine-N4-specific)